MCGERCGCGELVEESWCSGLSYVRLLCLPSCSGIQEDGSVAEPHCWTRCPLVSRRSASTGKGCGHVKVFPAGACGVPGVPAHNTITGLSSQPAVLGAAAIRLLWMLLGPSCACCWLRRACQLAEPRRAPWPEGYSLPGQGCASCNCSATLSHVILFSAY